MFLNNVFHKIGNTIIEHEGDESTIHKYNAPHHYKIWLKPELCTDSEKQLLGEINFQEGPAKETGYNGVQNSDLIAIVINNLEGFQKSEFSCRENGIAITHLETALMYLSKRTLQRQQRGVEGKNIK